MITGKEGVFSFLRSLLPIKTPCFDEILKRDINSCLYGIKHKVITYLILIPVCFFFGFVHAELSSISVFVGWIFILFTASLFIFGGKDFVDQGVFNSYAWKFIFIILLPLIFYIDYWLTIQFSRYHQFEGFTYYILFTFGFLIKKISKKKESFFYNGFKYKIVRKYTEDLRWKTERYSKKEEIIRY
jgi:hypothetical protein